MLAKIIIASGAIALISLLALHFTSPEFKPSWRLISEYALGKYKFLITIFFLLWGLSSLLLTLLLWQETTSLWAKAGLVLVFISGIGACMGGLFDLNHPLHGAAFGLGVPTLPIGALLVSYHFIRKSGWQNHSAMILLSAHATWISLVLMGVFMTVMMNGFKKAGMEMGPNMPPPDSVPEGVTAIAGYFNRLLVVCYAGWTMLMAYFYILSANNDMES